MNLIPSKETAKVAPRRTRDAEERFTYDGNPTESFVKNPSGERSFKSAVKKGVVLDIDSGLGHEVDEVVEGLSGILADTYMLYLKTQNYHWNITGPRFFSLHAMFMTQYMDLALAVDVIAERIRALGYPAPATLREYLDLASIKEDERPMSEGEMLTRLKDDQELVIKRLRALQALVAQNEDYTTGDLLTQRMQVHEKNAWMLASS